MTMNVGGKSSSSDFLTGAGGAQLLGSLGSILGLIAFIKAVLPHEVWDVLRLLVRRLTSGATLDFFCRFATATVDEYEGYETNQIYKDAEVYVASLVQTSVREMRRLRLTRTSTTAAHSYGLASGEMLEDGFSGIRFKWTHNISRNDKSSGGRRGYRDMEDVFRSYTLEFPKRTGTALLPQYLEHISAKAKKLRHANAQRMLFTNPRDEMWRPWSGRPFKHPACFDGIAMDPELKRKLMGDLQTFMSAEEFYKRVGRAWKRGYLLYGPPGTGKSSLIAAMANFTGYDVYDLELTAVSNNSDLRKLLTAVPSKSIIVIEDIDCSIKIKKRGKPAPAAAGEEKTDKKDKGKTASKRKRDGGENAVTLSGLLNFTDGLWSCCGGERLIIFTTNFVDKVDQALLRSGRMDFHINMSYCGFEAFKVLARTHLQVKEHRMFSKIEALLHEVEVTPADVAETLVRSRNLGAEGSLQELIDQLGDPTSKVRQKMVPSKEASSDEDSEEVEA